MGTRVKVRMEGDPDGLHRYRWIERNLGMFARLSKERIAWVTAVVAVLSLMALNYQYLGAEPPPAWQTWLLIYDVKYPSKLAQATFAGLCLILAFLVALPIVSHIYFHGLDIEKFFEVIGNEFNFGQNQATQEPIAAPQNGKRTTQSHPQERTRTARTRT